MRNSNSETWGAIAFAILTVVGVFVAIDFATGTNTSSAAIVLQKEHQPAQQWTSIRFVDDTPVIEQNYEPEHWRIVVKTTTGAALTAEASPTAWAAATPGEAITLHQTIGGLSVAVLHSFVP